MTADDYPETVSHFLEFFKAHYDDEIRELALQYPDSRSLEIDFLDIVAFQPALADTCQEHPEEFIDYAKEALRVYDLPGDVSLGQAHVRLTNISYPVSPVELSSEHIGTLHSLEGVVVEASESAPRMVLAAYQCKRCGTLTRIPQQQPGSSLETPHHCTGCERAGPFEIHESESEFVDYQRGTVEDLASGLKSSVEPQRIDVHLEDDIAGRLQVGQPMVLSGVVNARQVEEQMFELSFDVQSVSEKDGESVERWREEYLGVSVDSGVSDGVGEEFERFVERSREVIQQGGNLDEENTKAKIVTPFVHALGWNVFDSTEVELEYPRQSEEFGDRVDYALFDSEGSPRVVVEAKQVETALDGWTGQVKRYMRLFGAEYGVLTNGERYVVYHRVNRDGPAETIVVDCQLEELASNEDVVMALSR